MPFDSPPTNVDLSKPTLAGLAHILRNKILWPDGFHWNYGSYDTCAVGLAREAWGSEGVQLTMARSVAPIFQRMPGFSTAEDVACEIDRYLTNGLVNQAISYLYL